MQFLHTVLVKIASFVVSTLVVIGLISSPKASITQIATSTINDVANSITAKERAIKTEDATTLQSSQISSPSQSTAVPLPVVKEETVPLPQNKNIQPLNATLCNGTYYTACSDGQDFVCPVSGNAYCQPNQQQVQAEAQQQQANLAAQARVRYQAQYQAVQGKIQLLQNQISALQAICPNLSQENSQGEEGVRCLLAANQAADVAEYMSAIQKDFITPVTNLSIIYENKLDDLYQQIFQVKMDYHQQVANINSGRGLTQQTAIGREQSALTSANAKISALDQQIQFVLQDYENGTIP